MSSTGRDDESHALLRRALAGNEAARNDLAARVLSPLIEKRLAHRLVMRRATRQELKDRVQDVLVHLFDRDAEVLRRFDPGRGSLDGYVGIIAERVTMSKLRRMAPPEPMEDPDAEVAPQSGPEAKVSFAQLVRSLLGELSDDDRALLRAHILEDRSPEQVAKLFGISLDAAQQRIQRLKKRLKQHLSKMKEAEA